MANRIEWIGTIGCEGGPVLLANAEDFAHWTGAASYLELRKIAPRFVDSTKDRIRTLHYYGQFTSELPAPFAADGGHQYVECATEAEAVAKLAELAAAVKAKFPNVEISQDEEETHFLLPAAGDEDDREMHAELAPKSEYDASWMAHVDDEAWTHSFGEWSGLFWDIEGAGVADVGVTADKKEIVLVRSWVDEDEDEAAVKSLVDAAQPNEVAVGELRVKTGQLVAIWSPVSPFQLEGIDGPAKLAALPVGTELGTETMGGVGTILRVEPGRWAVTIANTDEEEDEDDDEEDDEDGSSWSCRWMRLTWLGPS